MAELQIQWLGHSCFRITGGGYSLVLDPYENGSVPGLPPLQVSANEVLCSHSHGDHCATSCVTLLPGTIRSPFRVLEFSGFHDDCQGKQRGKNKMFRLEYEDLSLVHLGDIGCEPTPKQIEALQGADALLAPVGGFFTMEPELLRPLLATLSPKVLIPMHYRSDSFGFDTIGTLEDFLRPEDPVVHYATDTLTLTKETEPQVAVLSLG